MILDLPWRRPLGVPSEISGKPSGLRYSIFQQIFMKHSAAVWFQYICEVIRFVHYRFTAAVDCDFKFLLRNMIFALYPGWSISSDCLASCWGFMWICWHQLWAFAADVGLRARMELTEQYISSRKTHNIVPLHSWTIEQCVWKFVVVVLFLSFFVTDFDVSYLPCSSSLVYFALCFWNRSNLVLSWTLNRFRCGFRKLLNVGRQANLGRWFGLYRSLESVQP